MSDKKIQVFCDKIKEKLGATDCRSFSGRLESLVALIDGLELGPKDCIFVSALAPSEVVKAILACGANPVLCDVTPDSLTVDHRALEAAVRHIISGGQVYPRAAIIENFCGMPFASRAIKNVCDRMGLILIEDCGEDFGGTSDGVMCGAVGDYSLISLGRSSVFGTGGTGSLVVVNDGTDFTDKIAGCDGSSYQSADDFYTDALLEAADGMDRVLASGREAAAVLEDILAESDFWVQRGSGRQKSSFGRLAVIRWRRRSPLRRRDFPNLCAPCMCIRAPASSTAAAASKISTTRRRLRPAPFPLIYSARFTRVGLPR